MKLTTEQFDALFQKAVSEGRIKTGRCPTCGIGVYNILGHYPSGPCERCVARGISEDRHRCNCGASSHSHLDGLGGYF